MSSVSAIELGVDSCVIARVSVRGGATEVSRVYGLRVEEAFLPDSGRAEYLRRIRREKGFPRHARVVAWGLPDGVSASDPSTKLALALLLQAGFVLDAVMSPTEALAMLARQRPRPAGRAGTAWLSLNKHAAAIAIVDGGELLFSRVFDWNYRPAASLREELLQRYSLVAHLAPELRRGFDVVRAERGTTVDAVITCGDLPDLRSLTMPLIEELDMEVETLDSLDGLRIVSPARAEEIADKAPALRLAAAVSTGAETPGKREPARLVLAAAAAIAILGTAIWTATQFAGGTATAPPSLTPPAPAAKETSRTSPSPQKPSEPLPAQSQQPTVARSAERGHDTAEPNVPAATTGRTPPSSVRGGAAETAARAPAEQRPRSTPKAASPPPENASPPARPPRGAAAERRMVPLHAPLPTVNSILVSPERRLAVVDGVIVHEGEAVGPRLLIRIEPDAVVLKEPSGYEVRVPIRRRIEPATEL